MAQLGGCPNRVAARRASGAVARAAFFPAGDTETGAGARSNGNPWLFRFLLVSNLDACVPGRGVLPRPPASNAGVNFFIFNTNFNKNYVIIHWIREITNLAHNRLPRRRNLYIVGPVDDI